MKSIVLDTNCLLQILPKKSAFRWVLDDIRSGRLMLHLSNEIVSEYVEVLKDKLNPAIAHNVVQALLDSPFVNLVSPIYQWRLITEDPDDNKFVNCYVASGADYLVSNDGHFKLLDSVDFPKINLLRMNQINVLRSDV